MRTFDAVTGHQLVSNQLRRSALSRITDGLMPDISADQKVGCPGSVAILIVSFLELVSFGSVLLMSTTQYWSF